MNTIIRDVCAADLSALTALYNQYILNTTITFDLTPYTVQQRTESWIPLYALRQKAAFNTSVETSIYLSPEVCNQGIGTQLYSTLFEVLSTEDVHRAYAGITLPNESSIALHRKFGFEQVGVFREVGRKFDRYWDVAWLEKAL